MNLFGILFLGIVGQDRGSRRSHHVSNVLRRNDVEQYDQSMMAMKQVEEYINIVFKHYDTLEVFKNYSSCCNECQNINAYTECKRSICYLSDYNKIVNSYLKSNNMVLPDDILAQQPNIICTMNQSIDNEIIIVTNEYLFHITMCVIILSCFLMMAQ